MAHDGLRPASELTSVLLDEFDHDPRKVVDFARKAHPGDFGRYAPKIVDFASRGDITALRLMRHAAANVDEALDAIARITGGGGRSEERRVGKVCVRRWRSRRAP